MEHINPSTLEITLVEETLESEIPQILDQLRRNKKTWQRLTVNERVSKLAPLTSLLHENRKEISSIIAKEMGKPLNLCEVEVQRTIEELEYNLNNAEAWLKPETVSEGEVHFSPLGLALVISPWNFPLMLPLRSIIPALLAGNVVAFKPSELTPKTGLLIAELLQECNPILKEYFKVIIGDEIQGKALVKQDIDVIAFTGSTEVGKSIFRSASNSLTRIILELGGLDAAIVLKDTDITESAKSILQANITNSGQVCNAVKRVFVDSSIADRFISEIVNLSSKLSLGDPFDEPDLGPLSSFEQLKKVEAFVEDAKGKGGTIHSGGTRLERHGYFYPSTIISNVNEDMRITKEEAFGPVLPIKTFESLNEALNEANASRYGLMASIWTKDIDTAKELAKKLDVGTVSINSHKAGGPGCPWGGAKESGLGRMKTKEGLREYTNTKLIRYAQDGKREE